MFVISIFLPSNGVVVSIVIHIKKNIFLEKFKVSRIKREYLSLIINTINYQHDTNGVFQTSEDIFFCLMKHEHRGVQNDKTHFKS